MTGLLTSVPHVGLPESELDRVELLASMQVDALAGREPDRASLDRLAGIEQAVQSHRASDAAWHRAIVDGEPAGPVEASLLAVLVAPLLREPIAWLFRQLDPERSGGGVPASLVQRLLPLDAAEVRELSRAAARNGRLARAGLLVVRGSGPDARLRVGPVLAETVGDLPPEPDPPGLVRERREVRLGHCVLPGATQTQLRELIGLIRYRAQVTEWGGEDTGGPIALFSGPPGVGKTLSASAVGGELGWSVHRLEMARIASRWVGVAERRLDRILDAAHARPMVLVLNEGETFFSKRGEVREARDRYANLFVSYLLDRIERHRGPFILTSNLRDNIDGAFLRRFHTVIEFSKPDAAARTELWRRLIPPKAPLDDAVDIAALGESVPLTGGSIRNAASLAAHLAAASEPKQIGPGHLAVGVRREIEKRGRRVTEREMGCLAPFCEFGGEG